MNITITINGLQLTLATDADYTYRSHINGMPCTEPDKWVSCNAVDSAENNYVCWYYNPDGLELDAIDYYSPDDIVDDYGRIIYDRES